MSLIAGYLLFNANLDLQAVKLFKKNSSHWQSFFFAFVLIYINFM